MSPGEQRGGQERQHHGLTLSYEPRRHGDTQHVAPARKELGLRNKEAKAAAPRQRVPWQVEADATPGLRGTEGASSRTSGWRQGRAAWKVGL